MKKMLVTAGIIFALLGGIFLTNIVWAEEDHSTLRWNGAGTCLSCHEDEARQVHGSAHYQWKGAAPYAISGPVQQGKISGAVNSYCINVTGNWNGCSTCHVGLGAMPEQNATIPQLQNVDCLVCHQQAYKRKKVNGLFVPDSANMTINMDRAAQTVHEPTRATCLQCHAKGGGGDNNKRGDMSVAHANTADRNFDVHMATTGADLSCQKCHTTRNHRIAGRGSDLRETDLEVQMSCSTTECHPTKASLTGHSTADVNKHVKKVACQTCHIKTYARNAADTAAVESTEIHRDWSVPEWSVVLNRWEPSIERGSNLRPEYLFWNMYSYNYNLGETAMIDPLTGKYPTSRPEGGINDTNSKLFPFKYKTALQPIATNLSRLIALDSAIYFSTGNLNTAIRQGLKNMGLSDAEPYSLVETDTFQLITHEVMPKTQALTCNECHGSTATQMNLKKIGYNLKGSESSVCTQCHGYKSNPGFTTLHKKHVSEKKIDCSKCHNFTRNAPSIGVSKATLTVKKSGDGKGKVISTPEGISCGSDCSETYDSGKIVTLRASADSNSIFKEWSGGGCSGSGNCILTVSSNMTVTATFTRK